MTQVNQKSERAKFMPIALSWKAKVAVVSILLAGGIADSALAQQANPASQQPTLNDKFEDVFFTFDQTFYLNRRFPRNTFWLFGSFPENEIAGDGRVIHRLYTEQLRVQTTSDPTLRTADLPTPFSSSLLSDALYTAEPVPPAPAPIPVFRQPAPAFAEPPQREAPIPALW